MSKKKFIPKCIESSASYQLGLDEGHDGLTVALNEIVRGLPPSLLREITRELNRDEQTRSMSPLAERVFQQAICFYQATQLLAADGTLSARRVR